MQPFPLFEGDRVLLCSDGVYRALTPSELERALAGNPQRACEGMIARAIAKQLPRQDNMTALVIGLDADGVTTDTTMTVSNLASGVLDNAMSGTDGTQGVAATSLVGWSWRTWAIGAAATLMLLLVAIAIAFYVTCCPQPAQSTPAPRPPAGGAEQPR